MSEEDFFALVNTYGADNILSIGMDNSSRMLFTKAKRFNLETDYDASCKCLRFHAEDVKGTQVLVLKGIFNIQSILIAETPDVWDKIDSRFAGW